MEIPQILVHPPDDEQPALDDGTAASTLSQFVSCPKVDGVQPHPETAEILRQVEYYFSDENLPGDAHLLARSGGDGNGPVSMNEILAFKKMKRFRPPAQVKASLKLSKVLEVVNNKQIKRRFPLTVPLRTKPQLSEGWNHGPKQKVRKDEPWLTKGMLKPTGFEDYATEGPIRPSEYEEDRKAYDPEESFIVRIENAVHRYMAKRKLHQLPRNVFTKFLTFGGFDASERQFGGGFDAADLEGYDQDQIGEIKSGFSVADMVADGIDVDDGEGSTVWSVDFVTTAKAFLSSRLLTIIDWYNEGNVATATNVLRNFYNYLLLHDVCPEYSEQLLEARRYCDLAAEQLPRLSHVDLRLPGDFATACSTLSGGSYSNFRLDRQPGGEWTQVSDDVKWTSDEAWSIVFAGLKIHGTGDQLMAAKLHAAKGTRPKVTRNETLGLEVTRIEKSQDLAKDTRTDVITDHTVDDPLGKLVCKRWEIPNARPKDLPASVVKANKARMGESFEFLVNKDILDVCDVGIKIEATVMKNDLGISWIDSVTTVYPSFFVWTANEKIRDWMEPGPPKEWMKRINEMKTLSGAVVQNEDDVQPD